MNPQDNQLDASLERILPKDTAPAADRRQDGGREGDGKNRRGRGSRGGKNRRGNRRGRGGRGFGGAPRAGSAFGGVEPIAKREPQAPIPPLGDSIRVIPLGGVEEIGRNMTAVEIGNDIIVIDAGFAFKDENTPGIDYILPNTKYLEERKDKIRGIIITHGHLDHIGGIPYVMDRIGNPTMYTRNLTAIMVKKRQSEFPHLPPLDIKTVEKNDRIKMGNTYVRFFAVTHTIPDSMGIIIETPYGAIVTPGDYKLSHVGGVPVESEEESYSVFDKEKVLLMFADSTNIENPGFSTPEKLVHENLDEIIRSIKGRLIIGTFASQLERVCAIIKSAEKYGKKVILEGRSMKNNVEIAQMAGILEVKKGTLASSTEIDSLPPDRIVILATGAQGEDFAALMRMATKAHKNIHINKRDTVLLSSSVIPGNERTVQKLKDNIARHGAKIIHYRTSDVYIHSTGHGNRGELEWLHKKIKPKFFIPVHGTHYMLRLHSDLAISLGMPEDHVIVPDNCDIIEIQDKGEKLVKLKEKAPNGLMRVDGFSVGDIQEVVIRDRQMLAQDGMFIVFGILDAQTGRLRKSPDIISRGFVYLRESQDLLRDTRHIIKKTIEDSTDGMNPINIDFVKGTLTDAVSRHLFQETAKRPVVIPVLLTI